MSSFTLAILVLLLFSISNAASLPETTRSTPSRFVQKKFKVINNKRMAYVEVGEGDPIVFLHGNPTSSYLWRNVMPFLEGRGRLIAPDLIGMGDSDKLDRSGPNRYTYLEHSNYLFQLLEQLGVKERVTLVIHDWGSALGFLWAFYQRFNPNAVKGIAFMEAVVADFNDPLSVPPEFLELFNAIRGPGGEKLILEQNAFIEQLLPNSILRNLTMEEMNVYRKPYLRPGEDRRPMLTWPRQVPIFGEPADVAAIVNSYGEYMKTAPFPKLYISVKPGALSGFSDGIVKDWANLKQITVRGLHFVQEDSPAEIGKAIAEWLP